MAIPAGGSKSGVKSEINITPLVDVVLVLLIIFMVVTPLLGDGVDVQMAMTAQPRVMPKPPDEPCTISISYTGDVNAGQLWFKEEKQADMAALDAKLTELRERTPGAKIYIKADRRLNFGGVKKVMKACNSKGFDAVSLITLAQNGDSAAP